MSCNSCTGCFSELETGVRCDINTKEETNHIEQIITQINDLQYFKKKEKEHEISDIIQQLTINSSLIYSYLMQQYCQLNTLEAFNSFKSFLILCINNKLLFINKEPKIAFSLLLNYYKYNSSDIHQFLSDKQNKINLPAYNNIIEQQQWYEMVNLVKLSYFFK
ncbi:hypothetical protein K502DRAFT_366180 [Neoconidiobolus thromboides FSU 785]|nr:hypothetical protein K502DRAFT_366180 [Neoconidiobolus thromboides FSU 785]